MGATVTIEEFWLDRLDQEQGYVEVDGNEIPGSVVYDAPATGVPGVTGHLGKDMAVVGLSPWAVYTPEYHALRREKPLIIICKGECPGLGLLNAEHFNRPYGHPAIHVEPDAGPLLPFGKQARLVCLSRRSRVTAKNVVITLPGPPGTPLVIMTPRSAWWKSTSERAGGLVCWLETVRALLAAPRGRTVVLTANSGHELGHLGLDDFLARRPGWDRPGGAIWLHYGANIGAVGGKLSVMSASADLRGTAQDALVQAGQPPDSMAPIDQVPNGETRDIHRAGGRYITLVGTNRLFHSPFDTWPHATDETVMARIAAASAQMAVALVR